jgi:alanine racemase
VLNGLFPGTSPVYVEHDLRPVLGSFEEIGEWAAFCRSQGRKREAAIHVDTGMNRLGLTVPQGLTLKDRPELKDFETALLMSHFVSAEESENPLNIRQIESFKAVRETLPGVRASLANSSGIFLKEKPHFDLVRPGYALYGGNPTPDQDNPMSAVVGLEARIVQLRWIETDETVGYNARWLALGRRRIATLSIGYADGYPRSASARGKSEEELLAGMVLVAGRPCPFAGNVSMDLIAVDVTDLPENEIKRGDTVTMIGGSLTVDEVGRRASTIGYEILTNLGRRYARTYRESQG